jgi:hypothetical protein
MEDKRRLRGNDRMVEVRRRITFMKGISRGQGQQRGSGRSWGCHQCRRVREGGRGRMEGGSVGVKGLVDIRG